MEIEELGKGCLSLTLFILPVILPIWIFDSDLAFICGTIAMTIAIGPNVASEPKEGTFKKEFPFTTYFVCVLFAYGMVSTLAVAFADLAYEEMRGVGKAIICYIAYPIIVFVIENKRKPRKRSTDNDNV